MAQVKSRSAKPEKLLLQAVLSQYSEHLKSALKDSWKEAEDGVEPLKDAEAETYWVYSRHLSDGAFTEKQLMRSTMLLN
ncbi:hypothetical protein N0V91_007967 [Didymella pomorum]|uniref:Uncharacterized protein n=1 Tax=Didymella pomorum TaxID=749634 RepID=A0A9W9D4E7_9PLEO|nr:hypothetical protein N0V91_007967 [Didymella pomorum]